MFSLQTTRYICEFEGCMANFGRPGDKKRHFQEMHRPALQCPFPRCEYMSRRKKKLDSHIVLAHSKGNSPFLIAMPLG
jgi:hypothetical protein